MKQENPFPFSDGNKRYHTYDYAMKKRFGGKTARVCLDVGMTCPNQDGSRGWGGCVYCSPAGSGEFAGDRALSVAEQLARGMACMAEKWPAASYIAYFQAHSNTYAPAERLRALFEEALSVPGVAGLAVATRPDCLPDGVCALLEELSKRTFLTVELGLQTVHDATGKLINRCHTFAEFLDGYGRLASRGIPVGVHLIDGLPGETPEMMEESVRRVASLRPSLVKLHLLYVAEGTALAQWYREGRFRTLEREEYVEIACNQLELLPPETVVGRLTGDGAPETLIAPQWSRKKLCVLNEIDKELARRGSFQGMRFPG